MEWVKDRKKVFWVILALSAFLFFFRLGDRSLRNPDEGRYAHIAAGMERTGDFMVPKIFGIDYLRKPPLFYWLIAGFFKTFGESEWSARAVPALFGVLGVLAAYFFSRKYFGGRAAVFSALLLLINPWYLHVGRYLVIDSVFSFFVVLSLYFYYLAQDTKLKSTTLFYVFFYVAVSLAFLTKGILALVFPGFAIFLYALFTRNFWRALRESHLFLGIAIFLLIASPWFWWMAHNKPSFWQIFFVREHLSRFVSENFEHQEAWYFYPALLLAFLSPWVLFLGPLRIVGDKLRLKNDKNPLAFLLIFSGSALFFLSLSHSKLATYILPLMAPLCVVIGCGWAEWTENHPGRLKIFYGLFSLMAASAVVVILLMEHVNPEYSTKTFALQTQSSILPADTVYIYDHPGPFYDYGFYFKGQPKPVGLQGEFEVSREDEGAKKIAVSKGDFLKRLNSGEHFYCLMRLSDWDGLSSELRKKLKVLSKDSRKLLFESAGSSL